MAEIILPPIGETSEDEMTIIEWLKQPGDRVKAGEVLLTVETDKAALEVEAADSGTLVRIEKHPNEVAKAGDILGYLEP